jgi:predicted amidophosphoribosyltransferase
MRCGTKLERKCPHCGADYPEEALFCMKCGTKLKEVTTPTLVAIPKQGAAAVAKSLKAASESQQMQDMADKLEKFNNKLEKFDILGRVWKWLTK